MKKLLFTIILFTSGLVMFAQQICLTRQEKGLIDLINQERTSMGYLECTVSTVLMQAANTNCQEILDETYVSHKPNEFGEYSGDFAEIRYGTSESDPSRIYKSLSFRSAYTDYSDILLSEEKYDGKNWQSIGICIRQEMIVIFMGDQKIIKTNIPVCDKEVFFDFDESSQYPTLLTTFPENSIMRIFSVNENGNEELYRINTLSQYMDKGSNLSLPLNDPNVTEYKFYIYPEYRSIVPTEPIVFSIKSSDKGKIYKEINFEGNSIEEIEAYLATGVNINATQDEDVNKYTMLHRAVFRDDVVAVKYLIDKGAAVNKLSADQENAIHFCRSNEMFNLLFENGAELSVLSVDKTSVLHAYAIWGLLQPIKRIVYDGLLDINTKDRSGGTPLLYAVQYDHYEIVKFLLENGAKQVFGWQVYPIHYACEKGNLEMVKLLVEYGADVNAKTGSGNTPLSIVKQYTDNNSELLKYLKENGAID